MRPGSAIFIGTTQGPVQVLSILRETGEPPSAVFLNGGTSKMRISAAYREFVERPSGFVERLCGHRAFRTDLSDRIDGGDSWHLGMLVSHIEEIGGRLMRQPEDAGRVIWCSGSVRSVPGSASDIAIGRIDSLPRKLQLSEEVFRAAEARGADVWVVLSEEHAAEGRELVARLCPSAKVVTFGRIPLTEFQEFWRRSDQRAAASGRDEATPPPSRVSGLKCLVSGSRWLAVGVVVLLTAGIGGLAYYAALQTRGGDAQTVDGDARAADAVDGDSQAGAANSSSQGGPSGPEPPLTALPTSAATAPVPILPASAAEASWLESVDVQIQASVAQADKGCFSSSTARLVEAAYTLQKFRATAISGKLCGGRLIVANRTAKPIVVGLEGLSDGSSAGMQVVQPHQSDYLILGPSYGGARILVRIPQAPDAPFSGRLFSGAHGVSETDTSVERP